MKRYTFYLIAMLTITGASAGPVEDRAASALGRKDTIALLRAGKMAESKQRLSGALPAGAPTASNELALGRQWVAIAFHFYTGGEIALARQAAAEALASAAAVSRITGANSERASLLTNTGLICERVFKNAAQAKGYYDSALQIDPSSQRAQQLQRAASDKIKRQSTGKTSGS